MYYHSAYSSELTIDSFSAGHLFRFKSVIYSGMLGHLKNFQLSSLVSCMNQLSGILSVLAKAKKIRCVKAILPPLAPCVRLLFEHLFSSRFR